MRDAEYMRRFDDIFHVAVLVSTWVWLQQSTDRFVTKRSAVWFDRLELRPGDSLLKKIAATRLPSPSCLRTIKEENSLACCGAVKMTASGTTSGMPTHLRRYCSRTR